jgi:tetratricopeptide (TPR) repeat protein
MVRHLPGLRDSAMDWRDPALTFNTSCYTCHVSQLSPNYDPNTDTFNTKWGESGIACETCHGPAAEHVRVCKQAPTDQPPADLKLITVNRRRGFSTSRIDSACAPCHAKQTPVTGRLGIGEDFFDHYGLTTLEDPDFFPDGRDLGENFTYTQWRMSPCVKGGRLDCLHCHTSSGRYRFADPNAATGACLPCHQEWVEKAAEHTHHKPAAKGPTCVSCHMPMTEFARMRRSDHSLRPPMPAATIAFGSPNACNLCHRDKDAAWADKQVRSWHKRDYQAPVLHVAGLVSEARKGDWSRLPAMLEYVQDKGRDEIFANSLIRLLTGCPDPRKWPILLDRLKNEPSPLIRSSAADGLSNQLSPEVIAALATATRDSVRLVRVHAVAGLLSVPAEAIPSEHRDNVSRAADEYVAGLQPRGHQWDAQYNLGNVFMDRGQFDQAIRHYQYAVQLRPNGVPALVNAATCYNLMGQNAQAEKALRDAVRVDPNGVPGHLNLGLLLGEFGRFPEAGMEFRTTLRLDPNSAVAAYNLAEILKSGRPAEALALYRKAVELRPNEGKYGCAYALCLAESGQVSQAIQVLEAMVTRRTDYSPVYLILGQIYQGQGRIGAAIDVFSKAAANERLPQQDRQAFREQIRRLRP